MCTGYKNAQSPNWIFGDLSLNWDDNSGECRSGHHRSDGSGEDDDRCLVVASTTTSCTGATGTNCSDSASLIVSCKAQNQSKRTIAKHRTKLLMLIKRPFARLFMFNWKWKGGGGMAQRTLTRQSRVRISSLPRSLSDFWTWRSEEKAPVRKVKPQKCWTGIKNEHHKRKEFFSSKVTDIDKCSIPSEPSLREK